MLCAFAAYWEVRAELPDSNQNKEQVNRSGSEINQVKSKYIRSIKIVIRDVFDEQNLSFPYRAANRIKVNTKEDIVRRELLIKEGDKYDSFRIQESGRNLRSLPFLREIEIVELPEGDAVDVLVRVQDVWTLYPVLSLSSGSGTSKQSAGILEGNLFGYGKRIEGIVAEDEGRRKYELVFDDRRFFDTLQRFTVGHFERSDGRESVISWGRPFRSLVDKAGWFTNISVFNLIGRQFFAGDERFVYRQKHVGAFGGYTVSSGSPSELLSRVTIGYQFSNDHFSEATESDFQDINLSPSDLPENGGELASDRRFSGPAFSYQLIRPDFFSSNYVDRFDRVEDFNLGNEFLASTHISPRVLGSLNDALILKLTNTAGKRLGSGRFIRGQIGGSARLETGSVRHIILRGHGRYYDVMGPQYVNGIYLGQHTLAGAALFESGYHLDNDTEFILGASNGLRGYQDRTLTGDHRISFNFENRVHMVDQIAKLVSLGAATFVDVGTVARDNLSDIAKSGFYANVGVGLRLGLVRSSNGTVVRIDLAFPLRDGPDGSGRFEPRLLFTTGQFFSASFRSDAPGLQAPAVSAGFEN
ncbi:MAG TPA: hypothetical protein PKA63_00570 [Oligoflexia bacterium]|nr:hypothetical protein [Oligoflexia bacterium]HMP47143.1 hypothetical protein [Oligoflexia bacterium]